jgi:hypothetical protein
MKVYQAINAVQGALAKIGISKDRTNTQGASYKFRGIDDVYNTLSPLLAEHGLCILPRMLSREHVERQSQKGNALFYVTVHADFDFVSSEDGSKHTVTTYGEAMDSGDKATNKAMSAAYKYAAFQAFAIPTEGDNDADAHTHEVKADVTQLGKPQSGMQMKDFPPERQIEISAWAQDILKAFNEGDTRLAAKTWKDCDLPQEEKAAVWFELQPAHVRTSLTKFLQQAKAA